MWKEPVVGPGKRAQRRSYLRTSTIRQEQKTLPVLTAQVYPSDVRPGR